MSISALEERCERSALWSAYGDALGFITELADASLVKKRSKQSTVSELCSWDRLIGGRMGAKVTLPKGCYSDDTQLRLATSRAISSDGYFDVESFAKIELPVWLSYALGAGRGTKTAAANLARRDVNWFSNFFKKKEANYFSGGGNGAAMRVQPHAWFHCDGDEKDQLIVDVLRNSIVTHGHPRGFLGAVFHSLCVDFSLRTGKVPEPNHWYGFIERMEQVPFLIRSDVELKSFWLPVWEKEVGLKIDIAVKEVLGEFLTAFDDISALLRKSDDSLSGVYEEVLKGLGGYSAATRGSGVICSVAAALLGWVYRNVNPRKAMVTAANALGSDTDTIATMCGAIMGPAFSQEPEEFVLDCEYIRSEALRVSCGGGSGYVDRFLYPDVSTWAPPRRLYDALVSINGKVALMGLGYAVPQSELIVGSGGSKPKWQWVALQCGQTVLTRRQEKLNEMGSDSGVIANSSENFEVSDEVAAWRHTSGRDRSSSDNMDLFQDNQRSNSVNRYVSLDVDELTSEAIKSGFAESVIGRHLLALADSGSIEKAIGYSAILAKARISRNKHLK